MLVAVAVAYEVFGAGEDHLAHQAILLLERGVNVVPARRQLSVVACLIRTEILAVFAVPGLVYNLVVQLLRIGLVFGPDRLSDVFLHRQRCLLASSCRPGIDGNVRSCLLRGWRRFRAVIGAQVRYRRLWSSWRCGW